MPPRLQELLSDWLPWLIVLSIWGVFFLPVLFGDRSFEFRDAGSFYRPLYEWTWRQWMSGQIPVWNDRVGIGTPVVGDATSALFYPGQIVLALPAAASFRLTLYVALHSLLAATGIYQMVGSWQRSRYASALAAIAYAFGGSVLFQHCNAVFLVGASWLPWSVLCLSKSWQSSERRLRLRWLTGWSATLSMMVLGGDPQLAYHSVLLAAVALAFRLWNDHEAGHARDQVESLTFGRRLLQRPCFAVGFCVLLAVILSAVQIGPSISWSRQSTRASRDSARSVYELVGDRFRDEPIARSAGASDLFAAPRHGHERQAYWFSVGPWRWMEWVWPNISGRMFPENRRWMSAIPAEGKTWSPSLYMGLPILFFAIAGLSWRRRRQRWLIAIALLSLMASLGWYGGGWFVSEAIYMATGKPQANGGVGPQVGGVYWLLTTLLPGYAMFRYPAKWLTVTTFAIAVLGAFGWDRLMSPKSEGENEPVDRWTGVFRATLIGLGIVSIACGAALAASWGPLANWLDEQHKGESFFGPFSGSGACSDIFLALLHCAIVAFVIAWALKPTRAVRRRQLILLAVAAMEITVANYWLTPSSPNRFWCPPATLHSELNALDESRQANAGESNGLVRVYRGSAVGWLPQNWTKQQRKNRLRDALTWNVATGYPQMHLLTNERFAIVNAPSSIQSARWEAWMAIGRTYGIKRPDGVYEPHIQALRPLGVQGAWLPEDVDWKQHSEDAFAGAHRASNLRTWRETQTWPRSWLVDNLVEMAPIDDADRHAVTERMREIIRPQGQWRDFRREVVIEESPPVSGKHEVSRDKPSQDRTRLTMDRGSRLQFDVEANDEKCLVVSNHYSSGWRCFITTGGERREAKVFRVNGVMQGVVLPAGRHQVEFAYRPRSLLWGAAISLTSWLSLAILSFFSTRRQAVAEDLERALDCNDVDA